MKEDGSQENELSYQYLNITYEARAAVDICCCLIDFIMIICFMIKRQIFDRSLTKRRESKMFMNK